MSDCTYSESQKEGFFSQIVAVGAWTSQHKSSKSFHMCPHFGSPKQRPLTLTTELYAGMIKMLTNRMLRFDRYVSLLSRAPQHKAGEKRWCGVSANIRLCDTKGQLRMASNVSGPKAVSLTKIWYGSCMGMTAATCSVTWDYLKPLRLDVCAALSKRRCFCLCLDHFT